MRPRLRPAGFSLLELLVALFVIVLVTSLATLNVGSGSADTRLESQLRQVRDTGAFLADEAQLGGRDYGMLVHPVVSDGRRAIRVEWRELREGGWRMPQPDREIYDPIDFSFDVDIALQLEEGLGVELVPLDDPASATPQVMYYASGEATPGAIEVRSDESGELLWRLEWDLLGRAELMRRGEAMAEGT